MIKYHIESITPDDDKDSGPYYEVPIPPRASELDLSAGDIVYLELIEPESSEEAPYIRGEKSDEDGRTIDGYYDVHVDKEVTIPTRWRDFLVKPVHYLVVETHVGRSPHFRIYNLEDYFDYRRPQLSDRGDDPKPGKPIVLGTSLSFDDFRRGIIDLASGTSYPSQLIRLRTVDPGYAPLVAHARDGPDRSRVPINADDIESFTQNRSLPPEQIDKLEVGWVEDFKPENGIQKSHRRWSNNSERIVAETAEVGEVILRVPRKGVFKFRGQKEGGFSVSWLAYLNGAENSASPIHRLNSDWAAKYFDASSEIITIYLPTTSFDNESGAWWS